MRAAWSSRGHLPSCSRAAARLPASTGRSSARTPRGRRVRRPVRVVVTGLVATYPVGGVAWDYLQYVLGFRALGCDVFYLEDTGRWGYDPVAQTFTPDLAAGARYLARALGALAPDLERAWPCAPPTAATTGPRRRRWRGAARER